ncbi:Glutathione import ATP-binding protein GsiA [Thalassovita gelatinovora]|uniref:Glutathione import ATP-binding protein GsiA n=1 Tax=Thalassovita gelatinovora TaxID=53501 RepID=A0A0N7LW81_THAGE|nr:oligopeptide/dipeptide ABC transporter ATP-binding protein [Thalassovita gelatinovora]QIZ82314.1 ATP-binding cassette domain-containing protein [Thalassovita gelatinovora]CUH68362.1 Glutathione import ATP-binding protein GsiA [Thalassovita gelatinovora]SER19323.1 oligopeptide transport system ATP-binding protein [Thalassovita gelatinovora]
MNESNLNAPLLEVEGLVQRFAVASDVLGRPSQWLHAVEDVSLTLYPGESLGIVGESGCGKSTLARAILHLYEPSAGRVTFMGRDVGSARSADLRALRRDMQIVLQDPFGALNPRRIVGASIADGLKGPDRRKRAEALLERVGLKAADYSRYPHEFSGGQRQRICIARALAPEPKLLIADEAVSALDVSVQAQILNLLSELRADFGLSFLFISHNLAVVRSFCDRLTVMYLGRVVETGPTEAVFSDPAHPYTRALISAVPIPDPAHPGQHTLLEGDVPSPLTPPSGCAFRTRCPHAAPICAQSVPAMTPAGDRRSAACARLDDVMRGPIWDSAEGTK